MTGITDKPLSGELADAYRYPGGEVVPRSRTERKHYPAPSADRPQESAMVSDAAARALAAGPLPPTTDAVTRDALYALEEAKARGLSPQDAMAAAYAVLRPGPPPQVDPNRMPGFVTFIDYLRGAEAKAALVEDATGQVLIPEDLTIEILREARTVGTIRSLASVRPTIRDSQVAGLLGAATVTWAKAETGGTIVNADVVPESPAQVIDVHDVQAEAVIGVDLLEDSPDAARQAVVESIGSAIGESEDARFAAGSGVGEPKGLALAANVARVPAGQKTTAAASATPVLADVIGLPWKLPTRYRRNAVWLFSEDAAPKIAALQYTSGDSLMPRAGEGIGPLGWPYLVVPGLPAMSTAGATDASVWFVDLGRAYRVVDRLKVTVQVLRQRRAVEGEVGMIVRARVGGDMVRPEACSVYLL
jgi:HK97 family phage major capsid protein